MVVMKHLDLVARDATRQCILLKRGANSKSKIKSVLIVLVLPSLRMVHYEALLITQHSKLRVYERIRKFS